MTEVTISTTEASRHVLDAIEVRLTALTHRLGTEWGGQLSQDGLTLTAWVEAPVWMVVYETSKDIHFQVGITHLSVAEVQDE